ncbi:sigma factor [Desulfuromonas versatilis]|uniref:protein acetyllysine N-acetyltransferase n=1 Tax=Desulfuromonas versatilis TaxID=2802975 RepID=A0ABN6E3W7_9BACT|nr:Sir2 family NAD-dependent protein deacetylase [Desulfuromonas versatilis]BCR06244.1 sigma factor [Desulfuromonas versatilis]
MGKILSLEAERCAEMIRNANTVVALTGAGISTAAGIPDFRGPRGLYVTRRYDPEMVFEIRWFHRTPEYFYEFSRDFVAAVREIRPTFTHRFLAALEQQGRLSGVITQNIDMLHQLAGSRRVVELHGSYRSATCTGCGRRYRDLSYQWWEKAMLSGPSPPVAACASCNGALKPDIVFFGELVNGFAQAEQLVARCDLLLVLGSTLQVTPASYLPYGTQAPIIVVNRGEVTLPPGPERYLVEEDLDAYFRQVAGFLGIGQPR